MSTYTVRVNALMFEQILSTNFVMKCMEISLENLYVNIGLQERSASKCKYYLHFVTQNGHNSGLMVLDEFH